MSGETVVNITRDVSGTVKIECRLKDPAPADVLHWMGQISRLSARGAPYRVPTVDRRRGRLAARSVDSIELDIGYPQQDGIGEEPQQDGICAEGEEDPQQDGICAEGEEDPQQDGTCDEGGGVTDM